MQTTNLDVLAAQLEIDALDDVDKRLAAVYADVRAVLAVSRHVEPSGTYEAWAQMAEHLDAIHTVICTRMEALYDALPRGYKTW